MTNTKFTLLDLDQQKFIDTYSGTFFDFDLWAKIKAEDDGTYSVMLGVEGPLHGASYQAFRFKTFDSANWYIRNCVNDLYKLTEVDEQLTRYYFH